MILIIILLTNFILSLRESPLCRVPHTANRTRQPGIDKAGLCRVLYIGHTAKGLPCATIDPRQKKSRHPGTMTWPVLCRVPVDVAHGKVQMFAVCLGFGTR